MLACSGVATNECLHALVLPPLNVAMLWCCHQYHALMLWCCHQSHGLMLTTEEQERACKGLLEGMLPSDAFFNVMVRDWEGVGG